MIILKIAFRNIFRQKRRSVLTGLMMAGGCCLFSVFFGMADGSYGILIDMFTRDHTGHIQIHKDDYLDKPSIHKIFHDAHDVGRKIEPLPYVESWAPRIYTPALAFAGKKTTGVKVMGIDPAMEARTTRIKSKVKKGRFIPHGPSKEVIIDEGLSRVLKVEIGGEIALIAEGVDGSIANDLYTVAGITTTGGGSYGASTCYMHIESAREFLSMDGGVHEMAVVLSDQAMSERTAGLMRETISSDSLDVEPWQVVEEQFYRAMQADLKGNWVSIVVLTVIIAVGVLNTVLMVILERTREFGVLRAMGTRPFQIFRMIVVETVCLAFMAAMAGAVAGMAANWLLSIYGIPMPTAIEWGGVMFDTITAKITPRSIYIPVGIIIGTALLVSVPPGIRAARITPTRAMGSV